MNYSYNLSAINPNNPQINQLDLLKKKLPFCSKKNFKLFFTYYERVFFATPFCVNEDKKINNINMLLEILNCSSFKKEKPVIANGPQNTLMLPSGSVFSNLIYSLQIHFPQGISSYNGKDIMNYIHNKILNILSHKKINPLHLIKKYLFIYSKSIVANLSHLADMLFMTPFFGKEGK